MSLFGRELFRFRYASVGLAHLLAEEYLEKGPLGVALAVLMSRRKDADPVTLSRLSGEERLRLESLISRKEYRIVQEVKETWSDRILKKGIVEGKRETLLRQLTARFGSLSPEVIAKVRAVSSPDELDAYLDRILTAESLEEIGL